MEPITDKNVLFEIVQNILRWCGWWFLFIASRANLEPPPKNFLIYKKLEPSSSNIDEKTTTQKSLTKFVVRQPLQQKYNPRCKEPTKESSASKWDFQVEFFCSYTTFFFCSCDKWKIDDSRKCIMYSVDKGIRN